MQEDCNYDVSSVIDDARTTEIMDVILRFRNVSDPELLLAEIEMLLDNLGESGVIIDDRPD